MLERETVLVGRKVRVMTCAFEVDRLPTSAGYLGFSVKIDFQSVQAGDGHQNLFGQPLGVCF